MKLATFVWALLLLVIGSRCVDFLERIRSPDMVALSFAEGGDDAYYFFTIARNIGAGHGITIDQVHWTSGFQPLWGFVCALPFAVASDRWALGIVYAISIASWLAGAALFVRFVRRASATPLEAATAALIAVLFLCEAQFTANYFNGMETGLYLTFMLLLLIEFQSYLQAPADVVNLRRMIGIGVVPGSPCWRATTGFSCAAHCSRSRCSPAGGGSRCAMWRRSWWLRASWSFPGCSTAIGSPAISCRKAGSRRRSRFAGVHRSNRSFARSCSASNLWGL